MKKKIKNLFTFLGESWASGGRGKIGVMALFIAMFMILRLFFGTVSIQSFVMNIFHSAREEKQLIREEKNLETLRNNIKLIQNYSPDYVSEMGLKHLNIGDPNTFILKIDN